MQAQVTEKLKRNALTHFLFEAVFRPQQIGAVLPSSKHLANAMAAWWPRDSDAYALELGPGTGAVTEALFAHGLREDRLIAIERSANMAEVLRARFPRAKIITGDAFKLDELLRSHTRQAHNVGTVFSSLPLRNFRASVADDLARQVRSLLPVGGKLVQYTYRIASGPPKAANHFQPVASQIVWLNVPPARVNVYQK